LTQGEAGGVAMSIHQCPKCELRFSWHTELDEHCRSEHPGFRHEYPVHAAAEEPPVRADGGGVDAAAGPAARRASESHRTSAILATWWSER